MRLCDLDALKKAFIRKDDDTYFTIEIKNVIDNAPTVEINTNDIEYKAYCKGLEDGKKIARPQGEWLKSGKGNTIFFCSECGREIDTKPFTRPDNFPFCHCGADMKGCAEDD